MTAVTPFSVPTPWPFGVQLAQVVNVADPQNLGRVQVALLAADPSQAAPIWARVAVPFAGPNKGAFLIPDKGDEVVVAFVAGNSRDPVVVGALWNGSQAVPETLGANGANGVDRWSFTGRNGTRVAIVEESRGKETISLTTPAPNPVSGTLTADAGGRIELKTTTATITLDSSGVSIETTGKVSVSSPNSITMKTPQLQVDGLQVKINAAMVDCSGTVKCALLKTSSVDSPLYTQGIGNIW